MMLFPIFETDYLLLAMLSVALSWASITYKEKEVKPEGNKLGLFLGLCFLFSAFFWGALFEPSKAYVYLAFVMVILCKLHSGLSFIYVKFLIEEKEEMFWVYFASVIATFSFFLTGFWLGYLVYEAYRIFIQ